MSSEAATLGVTLNRDRLNEALAPESFATDEGFAVELHNEGEPVHVHLRFTGPVADATAVETSNHYVDAGRTLAVPVRVARVDDPVEGTLRVVTGHGADGTEVAVRVDPPPAPIDVDESYARPPGAAAGDGGEPAPVESADAPDRPTVPVDVDPATVGVGAVAGLALVGAVALALVLDSVVVTLGVVVVFVAVAVAVFLLIR